MARKGLIIVDAAARFAGWFETVLELEDVGLRLRAIRLLGETLDVCEEPYLMISENDSNPAVRAAVPLVREERRRAEAAHTWGLRESDFAAAGADASLEWGWEYALKVCRPYRSPSGRVLVWIRDEDDALARRLALMKCCRGEEQMHSAALIVDKHYVNEYTRSARSKAEASRWRLYGRPRYSDPG